MPAPGESPPWPTFDPAEATADYVVTPQLYEEEPARNRLSGSAEPPNIGYSKVPEVGEGVCPGPIAAGKGTGKQPFLVEIHSGLYMKLFRTLG